MHLKFKLSSILFVLVFFGFLLPAAAHADTITLSGHIYDAQGNPVQNQQVVWGTSSSITDTNGSYSLQATSGTNQLTVTDNSSRNSDFSLNVPEDYNLYKENYSITQNTTLDVHIPLKQVTVHIQDPSGNPISGTTVRETVSPDSNYVNNGGLTMGGGITTASSDYSNYDPGPQTDSSGNVILWLLPNNSNFTYDFTAIPQTGSIYAIGTLSDVHITSDTTKTITLQHLITISGHVYDSQGNPVQNQQVVWGINAAFTDSSGSYTIQAGPGTNQLTVTDNSSRNSDFSLNVPEDYNVYQENYTITQDKTIDITIPAKHITIHVQNSVGTPLSGVVVRAITSPDSNYANNGGLTMASSITTASSDYSNYDPGPQTDSSGNVILWLIPNNRNYTYDFTAIPPSGSNYVTYTLNNIQITSSQTKIISLQSNQPTLVTAVNAGGATAGSFASDTGYSGGSTYSISSTVDTSGVTNPAPQSVYQTVRYGNFGYTVSNLTPNTAYTLRLHFNEVYFGANGNSGGVGSRVFNVSVNGTTALSNFDIYQTAGGANKAVVEEVPATSDSNGNITVQFTSVVDNAMVNGIEVDSGSPATTPTPTPTPISSEAINAGGGTSGSFLSDIDSTGGSTFSTTASIDTTGVTSPAPESVYQSVRYGNFTYDLTNFAPNSSHTVRLHFSEPYWGTALASGTGGDGSRVFNVSINGTQVLTNFDVYQTAGGADKAVVEEFPVTTDSNGKISIQFSTVTDNAIVSGIEVN